MKDRLQLFHEIFPLGFAPLTVLVTGGREFYDTAWLTEELDFIDRLCGIKLLVHGAAYGADERAGQWAEQRDVPVLSFPADWARWPRAAGVIRNTQMLREVRVDLGVAFPGGPGTLDMITKLAEKGIPIYEPERGHDG